MTILSILSFKRKKGAQVGVRGRAKRQLTSHVQ